MTGLEELEGPVEIAGLLLVFEIDGEIVKVTDADSGDWVGDVFAFTRPDVPLLNPCFLYREHLGTRTDDPRGSANRDQIAKHAKAFRLAAREAAD